MPSSDAVTDDAPHVDCALMIVDMISDWQFEDAERLLPAACAMAPKIQALKQRCKRAGMPVIYANDNHGRWRSDLQENIRKAEQSHDDAACIGELLRPDKDDYVILKPKHSAFVATPLHIVLSHLHVKKLVITGVTSDQCVLVTATEARMHDFEVRCPDDCIATLSDERQARILAHMREVLRIDTTPSSDIDLPW